MPKFQVKDVETVEVEEKPREFEAFAFLEGQSAEKQNAQVSRIKELMSNGALILVLDLSGDDMPTPERAQRGKGEGTNVIYGESKKLYAGFVDENSPVLVSALVYRPVAAEAKKEDNPPTGENTTSETNGNTETESDNDELSV
jgi:hypothetical protein